MKRTAVGGGATMQDEAAAQGAVEEGASEETTGRQLLKRQSVDKVRGASSPGSPNPGYA